ncbi:MAG: protein kinase domain-containing protein [Christensenellales bacterium]
MDKYDKYVGQIFDRRYRIVRIIGVGGMAVVFEAVDTVMKRTVAVKMLKEEIAGDAQAVKRFINESRAVSMLSHPNIVSIYDVSVRDDLKYIVMERVDGITLKNYMNSRGPLPPKEIMNYTAQILRALDHAHSKGIIHRDIKPQNIMLLKNGKIKVTDFGIAKLPNAETVTMTDKAIGTVYYISPEQASGKKIDPRSDIYSLGVVMYEMATGKLPFVADSPVSVALMQVNNQPRPPREILPSVPPGVEAMILTAMEKDPDKRFQSASVMLHYVLRLREDPGYNFKAHHSGSTAQIPVQRGKGGRKAAKKQSRSMFPIIAAVVTAFMLVLITTGIVVLKNALDRSKESQGVTVSVPEYVGSVYNDELKKQIEDEGYFNIIVKEEFDADHEEGYILVQDPDEGAARKVKRGTQKADVKLTVCTGAGSFTLDDYSVVEYRTAKLEMQKKGLKVEEYGEYDNTLIEYYTLRTDPPAGSTVKRGDTVKIFYSLGPQIEYVTIPTFVGMTESDAITTLNSLGISYGKITYEKNDKYSKGQIIYQSKAVGSKVPVGVTEIDFTVSLGDGSSEETTDSDKD